MQGIVLHIKKFDPDVVAYMKSKEKDEFLKLILINMQPFLNIRSNDIFITTNGGHNTSRRTGTVYSLAPDSRGSVSELQHVTELYQ